MQAGDLLEMHRYVVSIESLSVHFFTVFEDVCPSECVRYDTATQNSQIVTSGNSVNLNLMGGVIRSYCCYV